MFCVLKVYTSLLGSIKGNEWVVEYRVLFLLVVSRATPYFSQCRQSQGVTHTVSSSFVPLSVCVSVCICLLASLLMCLVRRIEVGSWLCGGSCVVFCAFCWWLRLFNDSCTKANMHFLALVGFCCPAHPAAALFRDQQLEHKVNNKTASVNARRKAAAEAQKKAVRVEKRKMKAG